MEKKTIGSFIATLRKANGLTQQELADKLQVSNKTVSHWERDESTPDLGLIPVIAEIFDVTCDELLKSERISQNGFSEKSDHNVKKQLNLLLNRELSHFKMMNLMALTIAFIGIIIGVALVFSPISLIGAMVIFVMDVISLFFVAASVIKLKEVKEDTELMENADLSLQTKYNKVLINYSYNTIFLVLASIYILVICAMGRPAFLTLLILVVLYFLVKKPYAILVIGRNRKKDI